MSNVTDDLNIAEIIGKDKYILLMKMYGGSNLYIQKYETYAKNERNLKIKKLKESGLSNRQLADRFNISIQHIRNIINKELDDIV